MVRLPRAIEEFGQAHEGRRNRRFPYSRAFTGRSAPAWINNVLPGRSVCRDVAHEYDYLLIRANPLAAGEIRKRH